MRKTETFTEGQVQSTVKSLSFLTAQIISAMERAISESLFQRWIHHKGTFPNSQYLLICESADSINGNQLMGTSSTLSDFKHCVMGVFCNRYSENVY